MTDSTLLDRPAAAQRPPHTIFLTNDHYLRVSTLGIGGQVAILTGRLRGVDGAEHPFRRDCQTTSQRSTFDTFNVPMGEGYLETLSIVLDSTTLGTAQKFVRVDVLRGSPPNGEILATLIQGYATSQQRLAWPSENVVGVDAARGFFRSITGTDQPANTEIVETVPTGGMWHPRSIVFTLVTDANAANREVELVIDDGAAEFCRISSGQNHAASLTRKYVFAIGVPHKVSAAGATIMAPLPDVWIPAASRIRTVTTNIQVTDNYGAPQLYCEETLWGN